MNTGNRDSSMRRVIAATLLAGLWVGSMHGQASQPAGETDDDEDARGDAVVLSPFSVTGEQGGRYQSTEATSGGRVRVSVFDAPQSISVVTRDLIDDVGGNRILDSARFTSGITESVIPNGLDRTTVRGFQVDGTTIDGFRGGSQQGNTDPVIADRLEVTKGPNAILSPSGVPGGTVNVVTRKPQFRDFGSISLQVGQYFANRGELDVNRVFGPDKNWAFRVVAAREDSEGYVGDPKESTTIMPMFSYVTSTKAQLIVQVSYFDSFAQNYLGVPVDPSSSSTNNAKILSGIPRDLNTYDDDYRSDERWEGRVFLTAPLSESINMRLAFRYADFETDFVQNLGGVSTSNSASNTSGGGINPLTGLYTPGFIYQTTAPFAPSPAPAFSRTISRGGQRFQSIGPLFNVQNDYVHEYRGDFLETSTLAGFAYNYDKRSSTSWAVSKAPVDYDNPVPASFTQGAPNQRSIELNTSEQAYISETVKMWDEKVAINGSYSYNNYDITVTNRLTDPATNTIANVDTELKAYGAVVKPIPSIALYGSRSEVASTSSASTIAAGGVPLSFGTQKEFGIRFEGLEKRVFATFAHFDIVQSNFSVPNPANLTVPPPSPLFPNLVADRKAEGWELELRANLTKEFSLIGNYTDFTNRDPNDVPFRGTAETSWAFLANYRFKDDSSLSGLSVSVGVDHLARRPGDAPGGLTPASTSTNVIPNQPTFWVPSRTLVSLMVNYKYGDNWQFQLNIDNLLDEDYIAAAVSRTTVMVGTPFNAKARVTCKF